MTTINIQVVYAFNRSNIRLENAPISSSIRNIKTNLQAINNMKSFSSIKIVYKGDILADNVTIESLITEGQKEITLYATGIPNLSPPNSQISKPPTTKKTKKLSFRKIASNAMIFIAVMIGWYSITSMVRRILLISPPEENFNEVFPCSIEALLYGIASIALVVSILFVYIVIKINFTEVFKHLISFCQTILPTWKVDEFKRKHRIE